MRAVWLGLGLALLSLVGAHESGAEVESEVSEAKRHLTPFDLVLQDVDAAEGPAKRSREPIRFGKRSVQEKRGREPIRFGKRGREPIRFGKRGREPIRFGKRGREPIRFGKRSAGEKRGREPIRFGKRSREPIRFGKRSREPIRFGKRSREPIRFGKRSAAAEGAEAETEGSDGVVDRELELAKLIILSEKLIRDSQAGSDL